MGSVWKWQGTRGKSVEVARKSCEVLGSGREVMGCNMDVIGSQETLWEVIWTNAEVGGSIWTNVDGFGRLRRSVEVQNDFQVTSLSHQGSE